MKAAGGCIFASVHQTARSLMLWRQKQHICQAGGKANFATCSLQSNEYLSIRTFSVRAVFPFTLVHMISLAAGMSRAFYSDTPITAAYSVCDAKAEEFFSRLLTLIGIDRHLLLYRFCPDRSCCDTASCLPDKPLLLFRVILTTPHRQVKTSLVMRPILTDQNRQNDVLILFSLLCG